MDLIFKDENNEDVELIVFKELKNNECEVEMLNHTNIELTKFDLIELRKFINKILKSKSQ